MPFGQVNNYNGRFFFPFNTVCRFFSYSIRAIYIFGDLILLLSRKQKKNFSWFHVFIQKKDLQTFSPQCECSMNTNTHTRKGRADN